MQFLCVNLVMKILKPSSYFHSALSTQNVVPIGWIILPTQHARDKIKIISIFSAVLPMRQLNFQQFHLRAAWKYEPGSESTRGITSSRIDSSCRSGVSDVLQLELSGLRVDSFRRRIGGQCFFLETNQLTRVHAGAQIGFLSKLVTACEVQRALKPKNLNTIDLMGL